MICIGRTKCTSEKGLLDVASSQLIKLELLSNESNKAKEVHLTFKWYQDKIDEFRMLLLPLLWPIRYFPILNHGISILKYLEIHCAFL